MSILLTLSIIIKVSPLRMVSPDDNDRAIIIFSGDFSFWNNTSNSLLLSALKYAIFLYSFFPNCQDNYYKN